MTLQELETKLHSMPEYTIVKEMASIQESKVLLQLNFIELSKLFEDFKQTALRDFSIESRYKNVNIEARRLTHNYLCSVISLIDHTRVYIKRLHIEENVNEYQEKIKGTFIENPICVFVKDLRQYIQHYRIPDISFMKSAYSIKKHASIKISKEELLKFSGWTKLSKKYINYYIGDIDLRHVFKEYQSIVDDFYKWLDDWQEIIFENQIKEVVIVKEKIKKQKIQFIHNNLITSKYQSFRDLEKDLYNIDPLNYQRFTNYDRTQMEGKIYELFEIDETIIKILIANRLKDLFDRK